MNMNWENLIPQVILPIVIPNVVLILGAYLHLFKQMNRIEDHHRGDTQGIENKLLHLDQRVEQKFDRIEQKFEKLDQKFDRLFEMLIIRAQLTKNNQLKKTKR